MLEAPAITEIYPDSGGGSAGSNPAGGTTFYLRISLSVSTVNNV